MTRKKNHARSPWLAHGVAVLLAVAFVRPATVVAESKAGAGAQRVDFTRDIRPLFAKHCVECHGEKKQKGEFRLDRKADFLRGGESGEPSITAGKGAESHLYKLVAGIYGKDERMPPKGDGLSKAELALVKRWIDEGLHWPAAGQGQPGAKPDASKKPDPRLKHWSFQPITQPKPPAVAEGAPVANGVDAFIIARLASAGLSPSRQADRATLIRRASLVLHGLPPAAKDVEAFVKDERPDAWPRLIERLLASPRYGERWASHWLDLARYAETSGFETNRDRPNAWRYRDYVIASLNADKPYDQFVREQIAGDATKADVATGFLVAGPNDLVKSPDVNLTLMQRQDELHDMVNAVSTAFLGLTVACARCHNHKFDPISQVDYFGFQAVFAGVRHGDRKVPLLLSEEQRERLAAIDASLVKDRDALAAVMSKRLPEAKRKATPRLTVLDDETIGDGNSSGPYTRLLATKRGHGVNPAGAQRGYRDDRGALDRLPNVSRGRYTWWSNQPGVDVMAYHPRVAGKHRLWLSFGCGWATHSTDARYVLDKDGDPATRDDQRLIAVVDQQRFAPGDGKLVSQPLWSGFFDAGVHTLDERSAILVRGGDKGTALTADVIALVATDEPAESTVRRSSKATGPRRLPPIRPSVNALRNVESFAPTEARFVRFTALATNSAEPCIDELEVYGSADPKLNLALSKRGSKATSSGDYRGNPKHKLDHINDGKYGNGRSWISNQSGGGWVQIALPTTQLIDRIVWGRDRQKKYSDRLATRYRIEISTDEGADKRWQLVASSEERVPSSLKVDAIAAQRFAGLSAEDAQRAQVIQERLVKLGAERSTLTASPMAYAGNFVQPGPTHRLFRGDPLAKREVVPPSAIASLKPAIALPADAPQQARRVALAKWITRKDHPLTARVMVNRIWLHHFGEGLVSTPSDFGHMGTKPSHPKLLDFLAWEFIRSGWSIKHMHRLILQSNTWQQVSTPNREAVTVDAGTRLLWRYPPRRIDAEVLRDSVLAVTGSLDLAMGGPGFNVFKPNKNYVRVYEPKESFGPSEWRRMVYAFKVRMEQDGTFGVFDCPDAGQVTAKRARSTTALQALNLLNSPFMLQQADRFAARLQADAGKDTASQVRHAYAACFARAPSSEEASAAVAFIKEQGLAAFCRAVLNSNEFLFIP